MEAQSEQIFEDISAPLLCGLGTYSETLAIASSPPSPQLSICGSAGAELLEWLRFLTQQAQSFPIRAHFIS